MHALLPRTGLIYGRCATTTTRNEMECRRVAHRAQRGLIRRDREIRIFGNFSFFMHARIISDSDFQTNHLENHYS